MKCRQGLLRNLIAVASFCTLISGAAFSESRSPYRSDIALEGFYHLKQVGSSEREREIIPTVRLSGRIFGEGSIDARFAIRRNKTWRSFSESRGQLVEDHTSPVLLQGTVAVGRGWRPSGSAILPVAASLIGRQLKVTFPGRVRGSRLRRQRLYTITMNLDGSVVVKASIARLPSSAMKHASCAAEVQDVANKATANARAANPMSRGEFQSVRPLAASQLILGASAPVITVSTDADPAWYAKYGARSNAEIASIINAAEVIYARQLGYRFRIVKQHIYTERSPYTASDAVALLEAFSSNEDNASNLGLYGSSFDEQVDLKHLFLGSNIEANVVGIAYVGVACSLPSLSYGITQDYRASANVAIFAHEVGHNLGAYHDLGNSDTLMYPSISLPPANRFSEESLSEIRSHLAAAPACFALEDGLPPLPPSPATPTPRPAPKDPQGAISLSKQRVGHSQNPVVRLSGRLKDLRGLPMSGQSVELVVQEQGVGATKTDVSGRFRFMVRVAIPRRKSISVYVRTVDGSIRSNLLELKRTQPKGAT